jgi:hypothetical protein
MLKAIGVSAVIGGVCAFLSCFITLKGWSLMGDALSHSVVPGVAVAYYAGWPFAAGAFVTGLLAAVGMGFVKTKTRLREDAVIGVVFTAFLRARAAVDFALSESGGSALDRVWQYSRDLEFGHRAGAHYLGGDAAGVGFQVARPAAVLLRSRIRLARLG